MAATSAFSAVFTNRCRAKVVFFSKSDDTMIAEYACPHPPTVVTLSAVCSYGGVIGGASFVESFIPDMSSISTWTACSCSTILPFRASADTPASAILTLDFSYEVSGVWEGRCYLTAKKIDQRHLKASRPPSLYLNLFSTQQQKMSFSNSLRRMSTMSRAPFDVSPFTTAVVGAMRKL